MEIKLLNELCCKNGVSGNEKEIADFVAEIMKSYTDEVKITDFYNVYCTKKSENPNAKNFVLDAHIDTVGLIVKEKLKDGFLKFDPVGGIDPRVLPAAEVIVNGNVRGIISSKPPHLMSKEDREKGADIEEMLIDTGNFSDSVNIGDRVTYNMGINVMGDCVSGPYLDDRAGVAVIIEIFKELKDTKLPFNLIAAFTVGEEMGFKGARTVNIPCDGALAIDVTHGTTPDEKRDMAFECGKGTAIGVGPNINPFFYKKLIDVCTEKKLPYQVEVLEDSTGTNAWVYQTKDLSVPCALLSFPLKFMHTPVETMAIKDYDNLKEITKEFIKSLHPSQFPCFEEV